jgi:hypothetical protein
MQIASTSSKQEKTQLAKSTITASNWDFWFQLHKSLMDQKLSSEHASAIVRKVKESHKNYVESLSLDDIERLANQMKSNQL